eukprot:gnl/Chilomastix_cuspidata/4861.p1 GENE.gnl/Chilomastix_cuspidata/4861~~gnl/Chilomastix_cuspidata/4861.p1  ORF type:complete len:727 (+),score=333.62 gnl/Chilomastix_cuspidata/4861:89-2269(+)
MAPPSTSEVLSSIFLSGTGWEEFVTACPRAEGLLVDASDMNEFTEDTELVSIVESFEHGPRRENGGAPSPRPHRVRNRFRRFVQFLKRVLIGTVQSPYVHAPPGEPGARAQFYSNISFLKARAHVEHEMLKKKYERLRSELMVIEDELDLCRGPQAAERDRNLQMVQHLSDVVAHHLEQGPSAETRAMLTAALAALEPRRVHDEFAAADSAPPWLRKKHEEKAAQIAEAKEVLALCERLCDIKLSREPRARDMKPLRDFARHTGDELRKHDCYTPPLSRAVFRKAQRVAARRLGDETPLQAAAYQEAKRHRAARLPKTKNICKDQRKSEKIKTRALSQLRVLQGAAHTSAASAALARGKGCLALVGLEEERKARAQVRAAHEKRKEELLWKCTSIQERIFRFYTVSHMTELPEGATVQSLVWDTFAEQCGLASSVDDFLLFRGAEKLWFVRHALEAPMRACRALRVTAKAIRVADVTALAPDATSALIPPGSIICATNAPTVLVYCLSTGQRVRFDVPMVHWAFVVGQQLCIGVFNDDAILVADTRLVLSGQPPEDFTRVRVPHRVGHAARANTGDDAIVFKDLDASNTLVRMTLPSCATEPIVCDRPIHAVGAVSGVRVRDALCVGADLRKNETFVIDTRGRTTVVAACADWSPCLLPSAANPHMLPKAAVVFQNGHIMYRAESSSDFLPALSIPTYSFVRIFQDVFLCFDTGTSQWTALRISVP